MIDRDLDIPELHRALAVAAARRTAARPAPRRPIRVRAVAALCVAVLALAFAGIAAIDASSTPPSTPVARDGRPTQEPGTRPAFLRCALALLPTTLPTGQTEQPGVSRC